jgi:hypothetical protein
MDKFTKLKTSTIVVIVSVTIVFLIAALGAVYWFSKFSKNTDSNRSSQESQQSTVVNESANLKSEVVEIRNTNIDNPELETNLDDLYLTDVPVENQGQSLGNTSIRKIKLKAAKRLPFQQYNVLVYFDSTNSWLKTEVVKETQLTVDQIPSTDWRVDSLVYFAKNNQMVYLMPSQNYSIEIVDKTTLDKDSRLQSKIDYPDYGTMEYVTCRSVTAKLSRWQAVECQYEYALNTNPEAKRDNGKIVSCYLPIMGTQDNYLKFSVGLRVPDNNINMCDVVLESRVVLVKKE